MYSHDELFLCSLEYYFGVYSKHQNNALVSAETVRHSSTYIILYLLKRCVFTTGMTPSNPNVVLSESVQIGQSIMPPVDGGQESNYNGAEKYSRCMWKYVRLYMPTKIFCVCIFYLGLVLVISNPSNYM